MQPAACNPHSGPSQSPPHSGQSPLVPLSTHQPSGCSGPRRIVWVTSPPSTENARGTSAALPAMALCASWDLASTVGSTWTGYTTRTRAPTSTAFRFGSEGRSRLGVRLGVREGSDSHQGCFVCPSLSFDHDAFQGFSEHVPFGRCSFVVLQRSHQPGIQTLHVESEGIDLGQEHVDARHGVEGVFAVRRSITVAWTTADTARSADAPPCGPFGIGRAGSGEGSGGEFLKRPALRSRR